MITVDGLVKGESGKKLVDKYDVGTSTTSDIKENTDSRIHCQN